MFPIVIPVSLGAGSAGAAGAAGGLGGAALTAGAAGAAGTTAAAGLGTKLMTLASLAGAGMGIASAFGSSSGSAPSTAVKLTPAGQQLFQRLSEMSQADWKSAWPSPNLVAAILQPLRQRSQQMMQMAGQLTVGVPYGSGTAVRAVLSGLSDVADQRLKEWQSLRDLQETHKKNAFYSGRNIMNIERQAPLLTAQAAIAKQANKAMQASMQGQALGNALTMLGQMKYWNA